MDTYTQATNICIDPQPTSVAFGKPTLANMFGPAVLNFANAFLLPNAGNTVFSLNSASLSDHSIIIMLDGNTAGTSFELEIYRNFEGMPLDSSSMVEMREAPLTWASSTMELLRQTPLLDTLRTTQEWYNYY